MMSEKKSDTERLKQQNAKLTAEINRLKSKPDVRPKRPILRSLGALLLVALAVALLTVGNLFFWTGNTVVKQDRFVAATQPIIKDPEVQKTISLYVTNKMFANLDVEKITEQVLPPRADFLAPQLADQLKGKTQTALQTALSKPKLQDTWNAVLAKQHERLIRIAADYKGDDTISLNDVYSRLTESLQGTKLAFLAEKQLPANTGSITVVSAPWLPKFHNLVTNIDQWRLFSVLGMVISLALAVWLSINRRRTIYTFCWLGGLLMIATLVALRVVRETIADKVDPQYVEGVRHVMTIVFGSLVSQTWTIFFALMVFGLIVWVSGGSAGAVKFKANTSDLVSGRLHGHIFTNENSFSFWVGAHRRLLQWLITGVLTAIMLVVRLTLKSLLVYLAVLILMILTIEVLSSRSIKERQV